MRAHMTSDLFDVRNDTGRTAFCGPTVLSAITGYPVSRIEAVIGAGRGVAPNTADAEKASPIKGTYPHEVADALLAFGYGMERKASYEHMARKERPSVWSWMQTPRNAWSFYVLAIHKGREGHWILIKGVKLLDTYTHGKWTFVCDGPHRGARIMAVYEVRKARAGLRAAGIGIRDELDWGQQGPELSYP